MELKRSSLENNTSKTQLHYYKIKFANSILGVLCIVFGIDMTPDPSSMVDTLQQVRSK